MAPMDQGRVAAIVLAAGAGSRFGGGKLLASVDGRPLLQHTLDRVAEAGIDDVIVVLGADAAAVEAAIEWRTERRVVNPEPERGLASSLAIGRAALGEGIDAVLIALGDQPTVRTDVIRSLLDAPADPARPVVVPAYADDRGRNPVLVRSAGFALLDEASGDRGLGPVLAAHPERVQEVPVTGSNPDVDTPADLVGVLEAAWAARVRANREQVDRLREVPDGPDFYAPVSGLFRADRRGRTSPRSTRCWRSCGPARRGSTSGRAPAGTRCPSRRRSRHRAGPSWPSTRRAGCSTRCGRMPRRPRSRTSGSSRAAGRPRTRRHSGRMSR